MGASEVATRWMVAVAVEAAMVAATRAATKAAAAALLRGRSASLPTAVSGEGSAPGVDACGLCSSSKVGRGSDESSPAHAAWTRLSEHFFATDENGCRDRRRLAAMKV